ncbi:hypothetical protein [Falsihalocynthiibacter arcticus]|uniref:Uncharacterized protein n=1 Tax=Falsihalocynthiibacter arcticus TaxID=1579316 RepID=A0A126UX60_9RHOB|nr:hypothetical protein [Falsihalocynthiibacter arcticus]AML50672.1 hypothetical protein RC74_04690 [Falsihalocynthiibacter arcticus]
MTNVSLQEKARLGRTVALARLKSERARQKSLAMFCTIRDTSGTPEHFLPTYDKPVLLDASRLAA